MKLQKKKCEQTLFFQLMELSKTLNKIASREMEPFSST